jgi:hypothetical protein
MVTLGLDLGIINRSRLGDILGSDKRRSERRLEALAGTLKCLRYGPPPFSKVFAA